MLIRVFQVAILTAFVLLTFQTRAQVRAAEAAQRDTPRLNILLFTADDLNCDSLGCYGSEVPDISPNLDRFAAQSMRFTRAHVTVAICQPSRGVLATGRYPHRSGVMGFMHTQRDIPTVMQTLRDAGYLTGVLGKVKHSTPHADFQWDFTHDQQEEEFWIGWLLIKIIGAKSNRFYGVSPVVVPCHHDDFSFGGQ